MAVTLGSTQDVATARRVPFFRPDIRAEEFAEVVDTLESGWLTTGPKVRRFEQAFQAAVNARYAIAVNSCTAALHLALDALGVAPGDGVLVPTMTFAATAEVVRYLGATPVLVDCNPDDLNMDLRAAASAIEQIHADKPIGRLPRGLLATGLMPVHVAGLMMDVDEVQRFASRHHLWTVEDAAHAFPAAWRRSHADRWRQCGERTATVSCFSFYANKTITTGEGGMVVTDDGRLAERMRMMALHGLSTDAWDRYSARGTWDYQIIAPGYKYNLTDIAAAIGIHQLARGEAMRQRRELVARQYVDGLADVEEVELPPQNADRIHAWHLFPLKLRLDRLAIGRSDFIGELTRAGIGCSVHWRPLHLHPYYQETFGWQPADFPVATSVWKRLVSLPIFSGMHDDDVNAVVQAVRTISAKCRKRTWGTV